MRVRELIARLRELDPEMRVVMSTDGGLDFAEIKDAFVDLVAPQGDVFHPKEFRDLGCEHQVQALEAISESV